MIKLKVPIDKIPQIRTIEGRKFKDGFWFFPKSSLKKLKQCGLIEEDIDIKPEKQINYNISQHLFSYQKTIVNTALNKKQYGIFADTGTGKTIMGLEITNHHNKTLIICPLSVIESAWIEDCNKFYPNKKIISLWANNKKQRLKKLKQEADIYIINFDGLKIIFNEILKQNFDCVIIDESSKMKNHTSQITQYLLRLSETIKNRYILSGSPTPNHNSEIFAQMKFINSDIFGNNYYGFLAKYFSQDMKNPHRWFQTNENKEKYFERLREQSIFIKKDDCVDLPDKTFEVKNFNLSKQQNMYYNNLLNDIKNNINQWSKFEFTAKLMKLREVCSGFIINKDKTITDFKNNKLETLKETVEEIGNNQIIVWCQFEHEIKTLSKYFNGTGLTSKTKNREQVIQDFKNGKIQLLFSHPKLLGHGLTFTNCTYNIYYSLSFSYEEFKQSQDRIHRIGQKNKCTYIILQARNSIEQNIYRCLQNKKSALDELYLELSKNN